MRGEALDRARLSIVGDSVDPELAAIGRTIDGAVRIGGRADLERVLGELLGIGRPGVPKTLDLIGHSTARTSLLVLGDWVLDATNTTVTAFFRGLAEHDVLPRLGVTAVRLLGCLTADSAHGRWTLCALADILGMEVYGTAGLVLSSYYDAAGFSDERRHVLASATELRADAIVPKPLDLGESTGAVLDIDTLPSAPPGAAPWPVHAVNREQAREILCLIRRRHGSTMPGVMLTPTCEIALPSPVPGQFHMLQVLLDGELVRVFPRGQPDGVIYPVDDPFTFRQLLSYTELIIAARTACPA